MIGILAFVAIFVATYYAYKNARDYGRNAVMWALIVFGVGFGLQIIAPLIAGIIIAAVFIFQGTPIEQIEEATYGYAVIINIVFIVLSVVGMFLILKYLGTVPDEEVSVATEVPPPPPDFDKE
jgi:uncharacterized BrkB/YihY/UPF0761 family membrane protein